MNGSRERILSTATSLFYEQGIQATGVEELVEKAGVSKRTLYKLFGSKDGLVVAYLERMDRALVGTEKALSRDDLTARERLFTLFDRTGLSPRFRGCPFHNAAVELAAAGPESHRVIHDHKRMILDRIAATAREAGAPDPDALARRLFVLYEGGMALVTSLDDRAAFDYAADLATTLITEAVPADRQPRVTPPV